MFQILNKGVKMLLLNLWSKCQCLVKKSKLFWRYKQYLNWISKRWNTQGFAYWEQAFGNDLT